MASIDLKNPLAVSLPLFRITEHTVDCQHIREWPRATTTLQDERLRLAFKQYTPLNNLSPRVGDVTIIAMPANGTAKETYEPLWEDLLKACTNAGIGVRNIWMADMSHQGGSFLLNEKWIGNDPHWFDTSRDYLQMINQFRSEMIRPIIGVGHSLGTAQLVHLSSFHPRLFHSLVLIEPIMQARMFPAAERLVSAATTRPDKWPTRKEAEASFRKNPAYRNWDRRAFDRMLDYALRELPTLLHDDSSLSEPEPNQNTLHKAGAADRIPVTLATPKQQEALSIMRANAARVDVERPATLEEKLTHPDIPIHIKKHLPGLYKSELHWAFDALSSTRPSVLYLYGSRSPASDKQDMAARMEATGSGFGGSGGAALGLVREKVLEVGHYLPCENINGCAETIRDWLNRELPRWKEAEYDVAKEFETKTKAEKQSFDVNFLTAIKALDLTTPLKSRISSKL